MFLGEPTEEELLELRRNNWPEWSKKIRRIFSLCPGGLLGYIDGRISCLDALALPTENNIWLDNDAMVRSFCAFRAKCEDLRLYDVRVRTSRSATNPKARPHSYSSCSSL